MMRIRSSSLMLLAALVGTSGCGVQTPRANQLFILAPLAATADAARSASAAAAPALVVGPINLPAYTERTAILSLRQQSELVPAAAARWAEPLDKNFTRVVVENLSLLLGSEQVTTLGGNAAPGSLQVVIDVTEFVASEDGQASLTAYWQILGSDGHPVIAGRKTRYQETAADKGTAALVAAMSRTLAALSRDVAQTLAGMQAN